MKLIVFDFDGTLVDSRALILDCHRAVFTEFRLPLPSPEDSLALIGRSLELVLAQLAGPQAPIPDMVKAYGRGLRQHRQPIGRNFAACVISISKIVSPMKTALSGFVPIDPVFVFLVSAEVPFHRAWHRHLVGQFNAS